MIKMILLGIFAYLCIGIAFVAALNFLCRHEIIDEDFEIESDNPDEIAMVISLWPLFLVVLLVIRMPYLLYKAIMILITTIIYTIKALVAGGDDEKQKGSDRSAE